MNHRDRKLRGMSRGMKAPAESGKAADVVTAVCEALRAVMGDGDRLDKTIELTLRLRRREWSERERSRFVETTTEAVRAWRWRWFSAGLPEDAPVSEGNVRRMLQAETPGESMAPPAVRASYPDWLWARAAAEIGVGWPALAADLAVPAPMFLRPNLLRADAAAVLAELSGAGIPAVEGPAGSLRVEGRHDVFATKAFRDGNFEVQDAGSQRIAPLLDVAPGMRVVDACAGAGGKALHLAVLMRNKGRIVALDIHAWKLAELRRRAARAGVDTIESRLVKEAPRRLIADRVLLDVPCSGLGVLRRQPDRKWRLTPEELARLGALQAELLRAYAPAVRPGGKMLYATCSILPSENEAPVRTFLAERTGWRLESQHVLHPSQTGGDGFFAALLERRKE